MECVSARGSRARPLTDMPTAVLADMETSDVSIFAVQVQRNELQVANADDRRCESATDAARAHGEHHAGDHVPRACARIMTAVDRLSQKVIENARARHAAIRATTAAGTDITAEMNPELQVVQDFGDHLPREVGKPAGRRMLHVPGRGEWRVCCRWCGGRLSLRAVRVAGARHR